MAKQKLTAEDERASRMMAVLMVVAKIERQAKGNVMLLDAEGAAIKSAKDFKFLIESAWNLFPNGDMETQVIDFAMDLGFSIEQHVVPQGSHIQQ